VPSIAPVIAATIDSRGIEAALAQYRSLREENPTRYNFREAQLNYLGYDLLGQKKYSEAIAVLKLNAEQYPQSFNVFDSLADAYVAAGKDAEAMQSYRQSLAVFPDKANYSRPKTRSAPAKVERRVKKPGARRLVPSSRAVRLAVISSRIRAPFRLADLALDS
jgi:tetratricopeptide (TPR) repeat protein